MDLSIYNFIGFTSGIYHGKFHQNIIKYIEKIVLPSIDIFLVNTSGSGSKKYNERSIKKLSELSIYVSNSFSCKGEDTFGIFKYIGDLSKTSSKLQ